MLRVVAVSTPVQSLFQNPSTICSNVNMNLNPRINFATKFSFQGLSLINSNSSSPTNFHSPLRKGHTLQSPFFAKAVCSSSSDGGTEYIEEPSTKVKFQTSLCLPGCPSLFSLLGTGYREKVFAIIGVKVYAAGFYMNQSILTTSDGLKRKSSFGNNSDSSLFNPILHGPYEKSLQIVLVRDVDGKTFWEALDEAISPRLKPPTQTDESALLAFRTIFQSRSLKKGAIIVLTWLNTSTILVCVSSDGAMPRKVDAEIESTNVCSALCHVFFGDAPVSPTLKASVAEKLATAGYV